MLVRRRKRLIRGGRQPRGSAARGMPVTVSCWLTTDMSEHYAATMAPWLAVVRGWRYRSALCPRNLRPSIMAGFVGPGFIQADFVFPNDAKKIPGDDVQPYCD